MIYGLVPIWVLVDMMPKRCFVNYYSGDGLQGNEFTHGAFYKDKKGRIYFGGVNGITYFSPESIEMSPKKLMFGLRTLCIQSADT